MYKEELEAAAQKKRKIIVTLEVIDKEMEEKEEEKGKELGGGEDGSTGV